MVDSSKIKIVISWLIHRAGMVCVRICPTLLVEEEVRQYINPSMSILLN